MTAISWFFWKHGCQGSTFYEFFLLAKRSSKYGELRKEKLRLNLIPALLISRINGHYNIEPLETWMRMVRLPSGSRRRVTPYSLSATWKAISRRSRATRDRTDRQSTRSGRFLWMRALKARPSRQLLVKSATRTPGYLAVLRRAHRRRASRAETFSSCPTTMSPIWRRNKNHKVSEFYNKLKHNNIISIKIVSWVPCELYNKITYVGVLEIQSIIILSKYIHLAIQVQ